MKIQQEFYKMDKEISKKDSCPIFKNGDSIVYYFKLLNVYNIYFKYDSI